MIMRIQHGIACAALALAIVAAGRSVTAQQPGDGGQGGRAGGAGRGAFVAYPQRPPGDPAAIERGRVLYGINCTFCHGVDARGGDGGGPNLLRSTVVLEDQRGERLAPLVRAGRGAMPPIAVTDGQSADIAAFLHTFEVTGTSRAVRVPIDIVVGDARKGEAYVKAKCASCHTTERLKAFAAKFDDPKTLQQMWLMPGLGGRGAPPPIEVSPATVTVTLPGGQKLSGRLDRLDDFVVSLTDADGRHRSFRTVGTGITVTVHDPLAPHKEMLRTYTDPDIHDVTAYLVALRRPS
jgi:cytochrome c oxidase cbb3-type subunit 3